MSALPSSSVEQETQWGYLYAVPLPYLGVRACTCGTCRQRFTGKGRQAAYEAHWLLAHSPLQALVNAANMPPPPDCNWQVRAVQTHRAMRELLRLVALVRKAGNQ